MDIKNFRKGDTVYLLRFYDRHEQKKGHTDTVEEVVVISVGRKYVYVGQNADVPEWCRQVFKQTDHNCSKNNRLPYLEERKDWGTRSLLFKDKAGIDEYRERQELEKWYADFNSSFHVEKSLSIEQLRKVREILTANDNG